MNDPVGITWRDDCYHLFFQHVPDALVWKPRCHWGHATSPDLFTWETHPSALAPGEGDNGCWSGCLGVTDDGDATILYTSISDEWRISRIRAASPADDAWITWNKGPYVADAPPVLDDDIKEFRDPFVFRDGDVWRMLVGAGLVDGTACVLTYTAPSLSLSDWTYTGVLASRDGGLEQPVWTGHAWECPQLVEVDGRHVLIVSAWAADHTHYVVAAVGDYAEGQFEAGEWHRLTLGPAHYAGSAFRDSDDAACLMLWIRGVEDTDAGWAGAQSIPLRLGVVDDMLTVSVHPSLERHRVPSAPAEFGDAFDVEWHPTDGSTLTVITATGRPVAILTGRGDHVVVHAGTSEPVDIPHAPGGLRMIVDGQILEVFTRHATYASGLDTHGEAIAIQPTNADRYTAWRLSHVDQQPRSNRTRTTA